MTVREIAQTVGKTDRAVRNWISKLAEKSSVLAEKSSASSPMNPADYDLGETIEIIRVGLGVNAAEMFRQNAENPAKNAELLPQNAEVMTVMAQMMQQQQQFMTAILSEFKQISSGQLQIEAPRQDYYSLVGYCSLKGIKTKVSELPGIGMKLREATISKGLVLKKIPDERWGKVNSYPVDILDEYFTP